MFHHAFRDFFPQVKINHNNNNSRKLDFSMWVGTSHFQICWGLDESCFHLAFAAKIKKSPISMWAYVMRLPAQELYVYPASTQIPVYSQAYKIGGVSKIIKRLLGGHKFYWKFCSIKIVPLMHIFGVVLPALGGIIQYCSSGGGGFGGVIKFLIVKWGGGVTKILHRYFHKFQRKCPKMVWNK